MLQLYLLTNTDITTLEKEAYEHKKKIYQLSANLNSDKKLFQTIKADLKQLKKTLDDERRTVIEEEIEKLTFNIEETVTKEDVLVSVIKDGYIKRTSPRSYASSYCEAFKMKEDDHLI